MTVDKVMRRPEVEHVVGLSRSAIYAAMNKGQFPRPIKIGRRAVGWRLSTIENWLEERSVSGGW